MDNLKFRVWDKNLNKYFYYDLRSSLDVGCYYFKINDPYVKKEDFIIEQCTGIKDKNGRLIYEGDIVKGSKVEIVVGLSNYHDMCHISADLENIEVIGFKNGKK